MYCILSLAVVASEDIPLIDIDNTVWIQLVLFLLVVLFLSKAVFKPYLALREGREQGIEGAREASRTMQQDAEAKLQQYESRLTAARQRGIEERTRLRGEGTSREQEILGAARADASKALEEARGRLAQQASKLRADMAPRVTELAQETAKKLLGREV